MLKNGNIRLTVGPSVELNSFVHRLNNNASLFQKMLSVAKLFCIEKANYLRGCFQVRANATAKATVAAFAASEGHAHPRVVQLPVTDEGFGFNIMGGKEQNSPIYISRIIPNGIAARYGGLRRGDQLLSVNGVSVEGESHTAAVQLLKDATGLSVVKLLCLFLSNAYEGRKIL